MMSLRDVRAWMVAHATAEAFRLETLQEYEVAADGSDYRRYLDGAPSWTPERKEPWLKVLRDERAAGFRRSRVRIVTHPITPYTRYECEWGYAPNVEAGERVRILDVADPAAAAVVDELGAIAAHDWWIGTGIGGVRRVLVMRYADDGSFLGADDRPELHVGAFVAAYDALWSSAEDFTSWWAAHAELHRDGVRAA